MRDFTNLKSEIEDLCDSGKKIYKSLNSGEDLSYFTLHYQQWYSKSYVIIKQLLPNRIEDFTLLYSNPKRKDINVGTYTVSDALRGLSLSRGIQEWGPETASVCMLQQLTILKACLDIFDSKVYDIQIILQADIFDSEIESAKHLFKRGFLRAAGAICGVILEKHFANVCINRGIVLKKKSPTIADYNDALKDNVYDTVEWRKVQYLGDIRNLCDHKKDREPTKEDVQELIAGTERIIKTIF